MALLLIIQPFFIRIGTMEQTRMSDGANPEKQGFGILRFFIPRRRRNRRISTV